MNDHQLALIPTEAKPCIAAERTLLGLCAYSDCDAKPIAEIWYGTLKLHYLFCERHQRMWAAQE